MTGAHLTSTEVGLVAAFAAATIGIYAARTQRRLAREGREWERRADAYLKLLEMSWQVGYTVQEMFPLWGPAVAPLVFPDRDDQARAQALVDAFASSPVRAAYLSWAHEATSAVGAYNMARGVGPGPERTEYQAIVNGTKPLEQSARFALGDQIAHELGSRRRRRLGWFGSKREDAPGGSA